VKFWGAQDLYSLPFFYDNKTGSGEPDMNQFGSHPNHENRKIYEGHPPPEPKNVNIVYTLLLNRKGSNR
jgi:hypothetical protein